VLFLFPLLSSQSEKCLCGLFLDFLARRLGLQSVLTPRFSCRSILLLLTEGTVRKVSFSRWVISTRTPELVLRWFSFVRSFSACIGLDLCSAHLSAGGHRALGRLPGFTAHKCYLDSCSCWDFPSRHRSIWSSFWMLLVYLSCLGSCAQIWSPCRPYFSFFFCADPARAAVRSSGFLLVP
jgi:hypothetical protein